MTVSRRQVLRSTTVLTTTALAGTALAATGLVGTAAADPVGGASDPAGGTAEPDAAGSAARRRVLWRDNFANGFSTDGPGARWAFLPFGPTIGRDGVATTDRRGLTVVSGATNPGTGEPAFAMTVGPNDPSGFPGSMDHVKWLAYPNHQAASGVLGFDAEPDTELSGEAVLSASSYGMAGHPFGAAVLDPADDLRLAAPAMPVQDLETGVAFDFFLTDRGIYAGYERLPHNRPQLGDYAAFLYAVPVARRCPSESHLLRISYDRSRGLATWYLDGREVFRVDRIGYRLPAGRRHMLLDHGGTEQLVAPRQLAFGLGMFNILDAARAGRPGSGLVRLTPEADHYLDPAVDTPAPQRFVDDAALPGSRLWGQGTALRVGGFTVSGRRSAGGAA
ncbi:DUF6081 family protein [Kitasatospora sp. NPDC059146]|uniref:DUF6081 family protein n=1 Tax=Kitasatospora sp. NPDC059146 TaxID=3346741 RepID=UPI0036CE5E52